MSFQNLTDVYDGVFDSHLVCLVSSFLDESFQVSSFRMLTLVVKVVNLYDLC